MHHRALNIRRRWLAAGVGVLAAAGVAVGVLFATGTVAGAAGGTTTTPVNAPNGYHACVDPTSWQLKDGANRPAVWPNDATHPQVCFGGRLLVELPSLQQVTALQTPPPVTSLAAPGTTLAHIGGSWGAGHTSLGTQELPAGTYLVTVTGDFYRAGTPGSCADLTATPVLQIQVNGLAHQVTAYTGAFPAASAETCGLGSDGTPNGLEQTASASTTIVVPAGGGTAELDAFGYNPDRGSEGSGNFGVIGHAEFTKVG